MLKVETKKTIYVASFTVLGLLIGFLSFLLFQFTYLRFFIVDPVAYCFGLNWQELRRLSALLLTLLLLVSGCWGYVAGKYWWRQIYVLKKIRSHWKKFW